LIYSNFQTIVKSYEKLIKKNIMLEKKLGELGMRVICEDLRDSSYCKAGGGGRRIGGVFDVVGGGEEEREGFSV